MKKVYVAGPIGRDPDQIPKNVENAELLAMMLVRAGYTPFCPHSNCHWPGACESDASGEIDWPAVDLPWVRASDLVVHLPGSSKGSDREVAHARSLGIPVFFCGWWPMSQEQLEALIGT